MKIIIKRLVVVCLFLIVALFIFNSAPEYDLVYKYKDGDIRVIFNDREITRDISKLPHVALLVDGEIMLSQDTVDILFDKNLYYEKKYETIITTSKAHRADLKLNNKILTIDDKTMNLAVPPISVKYDYKDDNRYEKTNSSKKNTTEEKIYIPIKALEEVYNMTIEFTDKIIITENNENRIRLFVNAKDSIELKHAKDSFAKNVEIITSGDYIDIYNYDETEDFIYARSYTGELGYIDKAELKGYKLTSATTVKAEEHLEKVNIAWDYINPDATDIGEKANRKKYDGLDVVAPTIVYLKNSNGELRYNNNVIDSYLKWANNAGYDVWITLKNEYSTKHFTLDETSDFLNDMNHRGRAINDLVKLAKEKDIAGINIDIEWIYQKDATAFSQFIRELSVKAGQNNIIVSVCVNVPDGNPDWSLCYQHRALSEYADYLAVMTYDQYGASSKVAGPNSSIDWVITNIEKIVEREGVESRKVLLGIPFYSRLWKAQNQVPKASTLSMKAAKGYLEKTPTPVWSEEAGQYYYENEVGNTKLWIEENKSIAKKLELIKTYDLGGAACWMLGQETEDIWKTIDENTNY